MKLLFHKIWNYYYLLGHKKYHLHTMSDAYLVDELWNRLVSEKRIDIGDTKAISHNHHKKMGENWQTLDLNSICHKDIHSMGGRMALLSGNGAIRSILLLQQTGLA